MRKKIFIYLMIIIFLTAFSITLTTGFYTNKVITKLIKNYENLVLKKLEEKVHLFYRFIYLVELDMKQISEKTLISIAKDLKNKKIGDITEEQISSLKKKYKIDDIYIVNRSGNVVMSTNKSEIGFNIFSISDEFKDSLSKYYNSGKLYFERVDPAAKTGIFKFYSYYGPLGKKYLIETSITLNRFIREKYGLKFSEFFNIKSFFKNKDNFTCISSMDIFYNSKGRIWSMINKGKYAKKNNIFFEKLKKGEIILKRNQGRFEVWKRLNIKDEAFDWAAGKYINIVFDFSSIQKNRTKLIVFSIIISLVIFILFHFIFLKIVNNSLLKKLLYINEGIKRITKGDYNLKLQTKGKDELTEISKNINKMANIIYQAMTRLKNHNIILEQKVFERTKELEYKNRSLTKLSKKLDRMAMTDFLTGLPNRRAMLKKIKEEKIRYKRAEKSFVLILIDIDGFKIVNDTYGHDVGDEVLKRLALMFELSVREQDTVCRWGGEEFLIFLPGTDMKGGEILAEKIRKKISDMKIKVGDKNFLKLTITLGLSVYNNSNKTIDQILKEIDIALYEGKGKGKNRVVVYKDKKDKDNN